MTFIIFSLVGFSMAYVWEYFCTKILHKTSFIISGWRLHHSLYSLVFLVLGFITLNPVLTGIGFGILVQHTYTDGFRFISKE